MLRKSTFMVATLLMGASIFTAHADMQYTQTTTYRSSSTKTAKTVTSREAIRYFISTDKERIEYDKNNAVRPDEVIITRCDLHQKFRVDNTLKIYTVSALDAKGILHEASKDELTENLPSGKVVTDYSIEKLETEKINGLDTQIYHFTTHTQTSGVLAPRDEISQGKMWVANVPEKTTCDAPQSLRASYTQIENLSSGKRRITYQNTGDFEIMNTLNSQLLMRMEITFKNGSISEETTDYSIEKLADNLFEVPAGYREVTLKEYNTLRSQAKSKELQQKQKTAINH